MNFKIGPCRAKPFSIEHRVDDIGLRIEERHKVQGTGRKAHGKSCKSFAPQRMKKVYIRYNFYILLIPKWNLNSISTKAI